MKITAIEPFHISVPYDFGNSAQNAAAVQWPKMETLFVKVTTDEGVIGWGEGFGLAACGITKVAVEKAVAPLALGRDPTDIDALMTEIAYRQRNCSRNGPVGFALSALDIALWDIAGKRAGKPLYRLLGGMETVERMPAYASLLRYGNADLVRHNSAKALARGYKDVKLHEIGVAEIAAAREAIGADIALTVDASCAWTVPQAIEMAKKLLPHGLKWLEEPLWPPEDYAGMVRLKSEGGIATAAGENAGTLCRHRAALEHRARRLHSAQRHQDRWHQRHAPDRGDGAPQRNEACAAFALFRSRPDCHHPLCGKHSGAADHRAILSRSGSKPARGFGRGARRIHARAPRAGTWHRGRCSGFDEISRELNFCCQLSRLAARLDRNYVSFCGAGI